jgi:hypothetical protein
MTDTPKPTDDFPDFPVRDFKYGAVAKLAHHDWKLHTPKNASLKIVSDGFRANAARIRFLMLLPTSIAGTVEEVQVARAFAEYDVTGELSREELSPDIFAKVNDHHIAILRADRAEQFKKRARRSGTSLLENSTLTQSKQLRPSPRAPLGPMDSYHCSRPSSLAHGLQLKACPVICGKPR